MSENHIDPELFDFHFGEKADRSKVEALLNVPLPNCHVMKLDLCSFSQFIQGTDRYEITLDMLGQYCDQTRDIILASGGMVDRVQGDGILALWNVIEPVEAKKVLEAATELLALADRVCAKWQESIDRIIDPRGARIGLTHGEVVLLGVPRNFPGFSMLGDVVNMAARLEPLAVSGQVVMSNRFKVQLPPDIQQQTQAVMEDGTQGVMLRNVGLTQAFSWTPAP